MEVNVTGINGDRQRLLVQLSFHGINVVGGNLSDSFVGPYDFGFVVITSGGFGVGELFVRVRSFGFDSVVGGV